MWDYKNGTSGKLRCPECPPTSKGLANSGSMKRHFKRKHRDTYKLYFGVDPPAITPCDQPGCTFPLKNAHDLKDHHLTTHGIEDPMSLTNVTVLRRMSYSMLQGKYLAAARAQNAIKTRITMSEVHLAAADVAGFTSYQCVHGLALGLWSESAHIDTDPGVEVDLDRIRAAPATRFAVSVIYVAERLAAVRLEADCQGRLQDGSEGTFAKVADELEGLVARC